MTVRHPASAGAAARPSRSVAREGGELGPPPIRLVLATTNPGKAREILGVLAELDVEVSTLQDFPGVPDAEEHGATFAENARAKALHYAARTGRLVVAEDSGLEIDALGGAPGVQSARFAAAEAPTYPEKFALIYRLIRDRTGVMPSTARFVCALALAEAGRVMFEAEGRIEGTIVDPPRGTGGFGYDPIFYYPPFHATLAEVDAARKASVSHRGQAFGKLREFLSTRGA
jgi:XTP/dITP diphosphohydrolase